MKERVFDPVGMEKVTWVQIGGSGHLGPFSQGYSGITTTAREHARFCYLALHKGDWAGKRVAPAEHYDFAWADLISSDIDWSNLTSGSFSAVVYAAIFGLLAWRRFTTKDITS